VLRVRGKRGGWAGAGTMVSPDSFNVTLIGSIGARSSDTEASTLGVRRNARHCGIAEIPLGETLEHVLRNDVVAKL